MIFEIKKPLAKPKAFCDILKFVIFLNYPNAFKLAIISATTGWASP